MEIIYVYSKIKIGILLTAVNVCKMRVSGEESLTIGKVYEGFRSKL